MKKLFIILILAVIFLFSACSKESKFGIEQFTERMNSQFGTNYNTADFILGTDSEGEKYMLYEEGDTLISVSLDANGTIKGAALLVTDGGDIAGCIDTYKKVCCVLTGDDEPTQSSTLTNCGITADKIKYADSNTVNTVGKYKYTAICNTSSVTLFCERA